MKAHALMSGGRLHTLKPQTWPAGDHRREWKWSAYIDGEHWRFFRSVKDWRAAVALAPRAAPLGPHGADTLRAVTWSEHEGRMILARLARKTEGG